MAADAAAIDRTSRVHPIHLALLAVARAGWDRDAAQGQSAHRGLEPLPAPPPLESGPGAQQAVGPVLRWGRWPHPTRFTPNAPRRVYSHGVGIVRHFVEWCAGRSWRATRGERLTLARVLATWARQPGMPPTRGEVGRGWWREQALFMAWFIPFWDKLGAGALISGPLWDGEELAWELAGEGLLTPEGELAFRASIGRVGPGPPEGVRHIAAEIRALGQAAPFEDIEWKPLLRWWRGGSGPQPTGSHPQAGKSRCPDCLEPRLRCSCERAQPELPWHWLQPCGFGVDQAGGLLCRRCRVTTPRASRVLWNPGCLGEPSGPGRLDGWQGGWSAAQWLDAHAPDARPAGTRRRAGWYNPGARRVRIPLPVGARGPPAPPAGAPTVH